MNDELRQLRSALDLAMKGRFSELRPLLESIEANASDSTVEEKIGNARDIAKKKHLDPHTRGILISYINSALSHVER